ncbi:hypothetical protein [Thermoleptolyngbya sp. C42_A2020_037]|uniref:hypothetical protein n=1 Tax=Thermoleptolyngbya sp. C42_A2020_037 TaxID=2747799 RepID=UPI0025D644C9|nr:hypothetical protein [Thermoleptolyngbya sp. C42_A2020_037]
MTDSQSLEMTEERAIATLSQAAAAFCNGGDRPSAKTLVAAMLAAESAARHQKTPLTFENLLGQWRLCFTTTARKARRRGIRLGSGFYWPQFVPAQIGFASDEAATNQGTITNQVTLGGLWLRFTGPCRFQSKKNLLAFDFTKMAIGAGDRPLWQRTLREESAAAFAARAIAKLPFFAFFQATPHFLAARGRGGGLAIWVKQSDFYQSDC